MYGIVALVLMAGSATLWFRRMRQVRLPANRSAFVAAWLAGALLGVAALVLGPGWISGSAAVLAIAVGGFLCFSVAISAQKLAPSAIAVGDALPDFSAPDERGEIFDRSSLGGRPLLLKFFRGHW